MSSPSTTDSKPRQVNLTLLIIAALLGLALAVNLVFTESERLPKPKFAFLPFQIGPALVAKQRRRDAQHLKSFKAGKAEHAVISALQTYNPKSFRSS